LPYSTYTHAMSKRLQVILNDAEYRDLQRTAKTQRTTVSDWVRQAIRLASRRHADGPADRKIAAVREAGRHAYPTADIADMLAEIEGGYLGRSGG
jgi:hypothetical protein